MMRGEDSPWISLSAFLFATGNIDVILNLAESGKWFIGSSGERKSRWGMGGRAGFPGRREPRKFFQSPTNVTNSKTYGATEKLNAGVYAPPCLSFNNKTAVHKMSRIGRSTEIVDPVASLKARELFLAATFTRCSIFRLLFNHNLESCFYSGNRVFDRKTIVRDRDHSFSTWRFLSFTLSAKQFLFFFWLGIKSICVSYKIQILKNVRFPALRNDCFSVDIASPNFMWNRKFPGKHISV